MENDFISAELNNEWNEDGKHIVRLGERTSEKFAKAKMLSNVVHDPFLV